eukprot:566074-Rhodomonas_salina.1
MPFHTPSVLPVTSDVTQHLDSTLSLPTSSSGAISHALRAPRTQHLDSTLSSPTSRSDAISHALRAPRHLQRHPAPRLDAVLADVEL